MSQFVHFMIISQIHSDVLDQVSNKDILKTFILKKKPRVLEFESL